MADTISIANLRAKLWSSQVWVEAQEEIYFSKFMGKMEPLASKIDMKAFDNLIVLKEDLMAEGMKNKKGYQITIPIAMKLSGAGVTGDNDLEGSEEGITTYDFSMTVDQIRNAVRQTGLMDEYKVTYDDRMIMKVLLKMWLREYMDEEMFTALSNSPTYSATHAQNRHLYAGDATTVATLDDNTTDTGNLFDIRMISEAKRLASLSDPRIRPIMYKGKPYFICLAHPYQIKALRDSTDWEATYQNAAERGYDNPIFTGADCIINGVIVHEHPLLKTAAIGEELANDAVSGDNTATAAVARALFLGAQCGSYAIAKRPFWVEKFFDYGNKFGVATGLIYEAAKVVWNSIDYSTICLDTMVIED